MAHELLSVFAIVCAIVSLGLTVYSHRLRASTKKKYGGILEAVYDEVEQPQHCAKKESGSAPPPPTGEASTPHLKDRSEFRSLEEVSRGLLPVLLAGTEKNHPWLNELEQLAAQAAPGSTIAAPNELWCNVASIWAWQHYPEKQLSFKAVEESH
jgi:hypothetical protein